MRPDGCISFSLVRRLRRGKPSNRGSRPSGCFRCSIRLRAGRWRPLEPAPDDLLAGAFHDVGSDRQSAFSTGSRRWAARPQAAARRRGGRGRPMGAPARNRRSLAGRGRTGEPDGAGRPGPSRRRKISAGIPLPPERRAAAGDAEKPRAMQERTVIETGSGKPAGFRGASERAKAILTWSAHLHAGRRQTSTPHIEQAGHAKALDPTLGIGQGKTPVSLGRPHTKALLLNPRQNF